MDKKAKYAEAGRRFRLASLDDLKQRWLKAFEAYVLPDGQSLNGEMVSLANDIESELSLRGDEPPYHQAEGAMIALQKAVLSAYEDTKRDPDRHEKAKESAYTDFLAYQAAVKSGH